MAVVIEQDEIAPAVTVGEYRLPPGLRPVPLYSRRRLARFADPLALYQSLAETFGPIARYRFLGSDNVLVNDAALAQQILIDQATSFGGEKTMRHLTQVVGNGVVTTDGAAHLQQRKHIAPVFHRQRIATYAHTMVEAAHEVSDAWKPGQEIDLSMAMNGISQKAIARTLFGENAETVMRFVLEDMHTLLKLFILSVLFPRAGALLSLPLPGTGKFRRARRRLDATLAGMIAAKRALPLGQLEAREDMLSMLVTTFSGTQKGPNAQQSEDKLIADEATTLVFAGHHSMGAAMTWTWYLLSQHVEIRERLYREVDEVLGRGAKGRKATMEDYSRLPYVEMVFAEAIRLYPPGWVIPRESKATVELGEYRFPPGMSFFISPWILHRSPEFWDDPAAFRPERHTPEAKASRPRFAYIPFGAGRRQCAGEAFAWLEGVLATATIAQRWQLDFVPGRPVELDARFVLAPKHPMIMRVSER